MRPKQKEKTAKGFVERFYATEAKGKKGQAVSYSVFTRPRTKKMAQNSLLQKFSLFKNEVFQTLLTHSKSISRTLLNKGFFLKS